jgi:hypothetical protein
MKTKQILITHAQDLHYHMFYHLGMYIPSKATGYVKIN